MFVTAVEDFVLSGTPLALGGFAAAWAARLAALRGWWGPHPLTLTRVHSAALLLPSVAAVCACLSGLPGQPMSEDLRRAVNALL